MENKELKESYIDEKTGIEYRLVGDYYVPNCILKKDVFDKLKVDQKFN